MKGSEALFIEAVGLTKVAGSAAAQLLPTNGARRHWEGGRGRRRKKKTTNQKATAMNEKGRLREATKTRRKACTWVRPCMRY